MAAAIKCSVEEDSKGVKFGADRPTIVKSVGLDAVYANDAADAVGTLTLQLTGWPTALPIPSYLL